MSQTIPSPAEARRPDAGDIARDSTEHVARARRLSRAGQEAAELAGAILFADMIFERIRSRTAELVKVGGLGAYERGRFDACREIEAAKREVLASARLG